MNKHVNWLKENLGPAVHLCSLSSWEAEVRRVCNYLGSVVRP